MYGKGMYLDDEGGLRSKGVKLMGGGEIGQKSHHPLGISSTLRQREG